MLSAFLVTKSLMVSFCFIKRPTIALVLLASCEINLWKRTKNMYEVDELCHLFPYRVFRNSIIKLISH